jgi:copper chaperone NosL
MIISEARYASAYRLANGEQRSFDDIGDMLAYYNTHDDEVAVFWVHDFNSLEWVRANDAYFVVGGELSTPMGHGLAAFSSEADAAAFAQSLDGAVHTFGDLLANPVRTTSLRKVGRSGSTGCWTSPRTAPLACCMAGVDIRSAQQGSGW